MVVDSAPATVSEPRLLRHGSWIACPALGAAVVVGLAALASWASRQEWVPFRGVFRLVNSIPQPWRFLAAAAVGLLAGLVFAMLWAAERLVLEVGADGVTFRRGKHSGTVPRADIADSYVDGKYVVLADAAGDELARERSDLPAERVRAAFGVHDYPFSEGNPHLAHYRPWVTGSTELPPGADATLEARRKALRGLDDAKARRYTAELRRLGVLVREEKSEQFWRPTSWLGERNGERSGERG